MFDHDFYQQNGQLSKHIIMQGQRGKQDWKGQNTLPGYICMEKIIILRSDCESRGASAPPAPVAQPPLICININA